MRRYGESVEGVTAAIEAMRPALAAGLTRAGFARRHAAGRRPQCARLRLLGPGSQTRGRPVHELAGLAAPHPLTTAFTISLGRARGDGRGRRQGGRAARCSRSSSAAKTSKAATPRALPRCAPPRPKRRSSSMPMKVGARTNLAANLAACAAAGVALVEQPLPDGARSCACGHQTPDSGLRRRERARPRFAGGARRQI